MFLLCSQRSCNSPLGRPAVVGMFEEVVSPRISAALIRRPIGRRYQPATLDRVPEEGRNASRSAVIIGRSEEEGRMPRRVRLEAAECALGNRQGRVPGFSILRIHPLRMRDSTQLSLPSGWRGFGQNENCEGTLRTFRSDGPNSGPCLELLRGRTRLTMAYARASISAGVQNRNGCRPGRRPQRARSPTTSVAFIRSGYADGARPVARSSSTERQQLDPVHESSE